MFTKDHQHHIDKVCSMKEDLKGIYMHLVIKSIAISMISIFVPIQLLKLGFSLSQTFAYLLVQWGCFALLAPLSSMVISRIGIKEVILLRTPILVGALIYLGAMNSNDALRAYYMFPAVLLGLSASLYTLSISSLFTQFMHRKSEGSETSKFIALPTLGTVVGPLIGGWVVMIFGFATLYTIVSVVLMSSIIPIAFVKGNLDHPGFRFSAFMQFFRTHRKMFLMLNLYGIKGFVFFMVLPIALYLNRDNILALGAIMSVITLFNVLCAFKIGHTVDKYGKRKILKFGALGTAFMLVTLGLLMHSTLLIYLSVVAGMVKILLDVPFESIVYDAAKSSESPLEFLAFKEFSFFFGRALLFTGLIIFADKIQYAFYIGSISTLPIIFL